jgi:enolase
MRLTRMETGMTHKLTITATAILPISLSRARAPAESMPHKPVFNYSGKMVTNKHNFSTFEYKFRVPKSRS